MDDKKAMDDKGIPKELFEKNPRIKPVDSQGRRELSQKPVEAESENEKGIAEERTGEVFSGSPPFTVDTSEREKKEEIGAKEERTTEVETTPVIEVEESIEKITSLPTIEASPIRPRPSQLPRYFEFEEESGLVVKKESFYEPQSYALPGIEDTIEEKSKSFNPLVWLILIVVLLVLVFIVYIVYRLVF